MDIHTIAYFIAIAYLFSSTLFTIITGKNAIGYNHQNLLVLMSTLLIAYDYSFTHKYISF
jgi:hypothetical protein